VKVVFMTCDKVCWRRGVD